MAKEFYPGMGQAVAERTILRKKEDGKWESWDDVAHRVALGNSLLSHDDEEQKSEYDLLKRHIANATILMSGRHLQHGDETQPTRPQEVYTNCSTSCTSFALFYLLMNGSGVGRSYDDDMMLVDWDNAPAIQCVLDHAHPDFDWSAHTSVRDARHKYGNDSSVKWFNVPSDRSRWSEAVEDWSMRTDGKIVCEEKNGIIWVQVNDSREGWAKALEIYETLAFEKIHRNKLVIFDFSPVRPNKQPIKGMQGRPASGPVPLMNAFNKASTIRGARMDRWKQAMYVDHYFAECVLVGGARRAARMSTKWWKDTTVLDFITVKRPVEYNGLSLEEVVALRKLAGVNSPSSFLWSSNDSIMVDEDFWEFLNLNEGDQGYNDGLAVHARRVFQVATQCAYGDGTGEPGFINVHRLHSSKKGLDKLDRGEFIGSKRYQVEEDTTIYLDKLMKRAKKKKFFMIVNPCVVADTWVQTSCGPRQVQDLIDKEFVAIVDGKPYKASGFWKTGDKKVIRLKTQRGYQLDLTEDHKVKVERSRKQRLHGGYVMTYEWVEAKNLHPGDKVVLNDHRGNSWKGLGSFEGGWLVGEIVGDGGYNPDLYPTYLRFWGESKSDMSNQAVAAIDATGLKIRTDFVGGSFNKCNDTETTRCAALTVLCDGLIEPVTKRILPALEMYGSDFCRGFLRGLFDADGTVLCNIEKGRSVRLGQVSLERLCTVQRMLARLGIASTLYENRKEPGYKKMPDGTGGQDFYWCDAFHELVISKDNITRFAELIGFHEPKKREELQKCLHTIKRGAYKERFTSKIESVTPLTVAPVYDCTVEEVHAFDANGIMAHNCSEIPIALFGAYCVIGDVVPYHADSLDEAEEAFRATTRALIRVNRLDSLYSKEVSRTNRIGVAITGIHEFAWKFFNYGFRDLIDESKSLDFWLTLARFNRAVREEAESYCAKHGYEVPFTYVTIKPAGTTSKLFGLTEGWHLPAMAWYLRWVQFRQDDPLVGQYQETGYPVKHLHQYKNTVIVGFPTAPLLTTMGMGRKLVTAGQATPEEQYKWLKLGEKYWIQGTSVDGSEFLEDRGGQISYCLAGGRKHLIPTDKGFQRIENAQPSRTPDRNGMPQDIVVRYDNGVKEVTEIKLANGLKIAGTGDHKVLTIDDNLKMSWRKIDELVVGDVVVRRCGDYPTAEAATELPPCPTSTGRQYKKIRTPKFLTGDLALWLGMLMSDTVGHQWTNGVGITSIDPTVRLRFSELTFSLFGVHTKESVDNRSGVTKVEATSRLLKRYVGSLGIPRYHDDNFIPDYVLEASRKIMAQFILGYTLNGHVTSKNGNIVICSTTSPSMSNDLAVILTHMGYDAYLGHKNGRPYHFSESNKGVGRDQFQVIIPHRQSKKFLEEIGFLEIYKNEAASVVRAAAKNNGKTNCLPVSKFKEYALENKMKRMFLNIRDARTISFKSAKKHFPEVIAHLNDPAFRFTLVTVVKHLDETETYDVTVRQSHEYLANSVVVHNTLKYDPKVVTYEAFAKTIREYQPKVKCCSVMPQEDQGSYEYLPEESVTKAQYEAVSAQIKEVLEEDVDKVHVDCPGGACPINFEK